MFLAKVRSLKRQHGWEKEKMGLCYEAGPTGFILARRLRRLDYDCMVVAPLIPTQAGNRVKTDRRAAGLFREGELVGVIF